jgi:CheY-like chemotaxis protein
MDVLVVEDETMIRMLIVDMIEELGHRVIAEAATISAAEPLARDAPFDIAILDINVAGQNIHPVASIVQKRGLPFVFASGYAATGLPAPLNKRPILRKPFAAHELGKAIDAARPT